MTPEIFARIRIQPRHDMGRARLRDEDRASAFARRIEQRLRRYRTFADHQQGDEIVTHPRSQERLQRLCDEFNAAYKPGDIILVRRVKGEPETLVRTISAHGAQVLGGHSAVVYVTDGGGCWGLDFVIGRRQSEAVS